MRRAISSAATAMCSACLVTAACGGSSDRDATAAAEPATDSFRVTLGGPAQRFAGWGAGVVTETRIDPLADPAASPKMQRRMDRIVFRKAGITLLRVWSPGGGFGSSSGRLRTGDGRFGLMRRAPHRVRFLLTGADAPHDKDADNRLNPGAEGRFAAGLVEVLDLARDRIGVAFAGVAVGNEVDNPRMPLTMTPQQAARVYRRLVAAARTPVFLGDNTGWDQTVAYVPAQAAAVRGARVLAVASHAYSGTDGDRRRVRALARDLRAPVWMTEWVNGCPEGDCPDQPTIEHALETAVEIVRDLEVAGASAWFLFRPISDISHGADTGLAVRDGTRLITGKRLAVFRQFSSAGRPGMRVRRVRSSVGGPTGIAFSRRRRVAVVLVNDAPSPQRIRLSLGRCRGRIAVRRTDRRSSFEAVRARKCRRRPLTARLTPHSVTTFRATGR